MVDLDLESPGLTSILLDPERLPEFGLVDYFVESASENLTIADFVSREGVIYQRSFLSDGTQGEIFVVPAYGIAAGDYIAKLSRTYVETPSDRSSNTRGFAERLHDFLLSLEQVLHPDVVLLDSRAGIDDIGAAIIGRLGGHTLLFGTSSSQTWRTCFSVVRILPTERRRVSLSFSWGWESSAFPVAFTPCTRRMHQSFTLGPSGDHSAWRRFPHVLPHPPPVSLPET